MSSLFAFLHHAAAFALVAALTLELVLLKGALDLRTARRLLLADFVYGGSAALVLAVGLARVFFFEKGAEYYFSNAAFMAKLALFVVIGLVSIYPTVEFLSWRRPLREGQVPTVTALKLQRMRTVVHGELVAVALLVFSATLMARGVGMLS